MTKSEIEIEIRKLLNKHPENTALIVDLYDLYRQAVIAGKSEEEEREKMFNAINQLIETE